MPQKHLDSSHDSCFHVWNRHDIAGGKQEVIESTLEQKKRKPEKEHAKDNSLVFTGIITLQTGAPRGICLQDAAYRVLLQCCPE